LKRVLNFVLELVRALAELAPAVPRQLRHQLHQPRELAVRPDEARIRRAQRRLVVRSVERRPVRRLALRQARFEGGDVVHRPPQREAATTMALKPPGSLTASSARILRSSWMPAFFSPPTSLL